MNSVLQRKFSEISEVTNLIITEFSERSSTFLASQNTPHDTSCNNDESQRAGGDSAKVKADEIQLQKMQTRALSEPDSPDHQEEDDSKFDDPVKTSERFPVTVRSKVDEKIEVTGRNVGMSGNIVQQQ